VDGIVRGLEYLLAHPGTYETVNLGNSQPVPLLELVAAIGEAVGVEPVLQFQPTQAGDVDITYADNEKAARLLGYQPRTTLAEGLRQFVGWLDTQAPAADRVGLAPINVAAAAQAAVALTPRS
jgi:UDP-glucuronate 4-epimerase